MKIKKLNNYYTDENTYIIYDENTKNGVVIDPGYKTDGILKSAEDDGITIKYVLITHCHYDHIEFLEEIREKTGAKLVSGDKGSINVTDPAINLSYSGLGYYIYAKKSDVVLNDGEELVLDSLKIKCIYTPGHTNCSVCYLIGEELFTGDTMFLRSVGRCDLPTGNSSELKNSVREKLYTLDEYINIHPGHGDDSAIWYEKKFNMFIKA